MQVTLDCVYLLGGPAITSDTLSCSAICSQLSGFNVRFAVVCVIFRLNLTVATEALLDEEVEKGTSCVSAEAFLEKALNGPQSRRIDSTRAVRLSHKKSF